MWTWYTTWPMQPNWPVAVFSVGDAAAGTMLWRAHGQLHVTVAVKATFLLRDRRRMDLVSPRALVLKDTHHDEDPRRSVKVPNDCAPYLGSCDIILFGTAYAAKGVPTKMSSARLALHRNDTALIDKTLYVYGARERWEQEPSTFTAIPIDYEHAYHSPSTNPVGVAGEAHVPNVLDANRPRHPGCFGAISSGWAPRAEHVPPGFEQGNVGRIVEIPDGFDWSYFQAAPTDQRVPYLQCDEWLSLQSLNAEQERIQSRLPAVIAEARAWARNAKPGDAGFPIALQADQLVVDADALQCTITWRGTFPITGEDVVDALKVGAGVTLAKNGPIDWAAAMPAPTSDEDEPFRITLDGSQHVTIGASALVELDDDDLVSATGEVPSREVVELDDDDLISASRATLDDEVTRTGNLEDFVPQGDAVPFREPTTREQVIAEQLIPAEGRLPWERADSFDDFDEEPIDDDDDGQTQHMASAAPDSGLPFDEATQRMKRVERAKVPTGSTSTLDVDELRAQFGGKLPWERAPATPEVDAVQPAMAGPPEPAPPEPVAPWIRPAEDFVVEDFDADDDDDATTGTGGQAPVPIKAPFALAPAKGAPGGLGPAVIPGAPWARGVAPEVRFRDAEVTAAFDVALLQQQVRERDGGPPDLDTPSAAHHYIPTRESDDVPQINPTRLTLATHGWKLKPPRSVLAVIVKASCELVPDGPAVLRDFSEEALSDLFQDDDPECGLVYASDFALFKERADVILRGHAHAPGGSATHMEVGFRFGDGATALERRMAVFGERVWGGPETPQAFAKIPLSWDRSYGGQELESNPAGRGHSSDDVLRPNLEDPNDLMVSRSDEPQPIGFAPIAPTWPARCTRLGTIDDMWADTRAPYFPADFDPAFFQAAPPTQQIPFPRGDEPFALWGTHPEHGSIEGTLPGIVPRCFAQMTAEAGGDFIEVNLQLDTIAFEPDDNAVHLVWRGVLDVAEDEAYEVARLFLHQERLDGPRLTRGEAQQRFLATELATQLFIESAQGSPAPANMTAEAAAAAALLPLSAPPPPRERAPAIEARNTRADVERRHAAGEPLNELVLIDADLSGLDLTGADLSGALMTRARLSGCSLRGANLVGTQLSQADLSDADLQGAQLTMCDLQRSRLHRTNFTSTELSRANLAGAYGDSTNFQAAHGSLTCFSDVELTAPCFDETLFGAPDFSKAKLHEATFLKAHLPQARMFDVEAPGARFDDASMADASVIGSKLSDASLQRIDAPGSQWHRADLDRCNFSAAKLADAGFVNATCNQSVFSGADLRNARFRKTRLSKAQFLRSNLMEAIFEKADLTGALMNEANLYGTVGWHARTLGVQLEGAIVDGSSVFKR